MNFLEQALDQNNQAWKFIIVVFVGFIGGQFLGAIPFFLLTPANGTASLDFAAMGINPALGLVLMVLPFAVSFVLCFFLVKALHRRDFTAVSNGTAELRWSRVFYAAAVWALLMVIYLVIEFAIDPENFVFQLEWKPFIMLLLAAVLIIPIQTTFEEYLLRGYFAQGVAGLTRRRWVAVLVPGLIFALLHAFNPEVEAHGFWTVMPQYITFGLVFGLMSVLDDGIELAIGAHAANNVFLALFMTNKDSVLRTPALFEQLEVNPARETIGLLILSGLFIYLLHRKYHWDFAILWKKVGD